MLKKIFKEAFFLVWKNPLLWIFGFFAGFLTNNEILVLFLQSEKITKGSNLPINLSLLKGSYLEVSKIIEQLFFTPTSLLIFLLFIFLGLFFFFFVSLSQGVLIKNTKDKEKSFKKLFSGTGDFSFKIFFLNLLVLIFISLMTYLFIFKLFLFKNQFLPFVSLLIIFLIVFFLSFIVRYTICFLCLENKSLFSSLNEGFKFFFKNILISVIVSLFIFLFHFFTGFLSLLIGTGTFYSLSVLIQFLDYLHLNNLIWFFTLSSIVISAFIFIVLYSIFIAWQYSVWALLFLKIKSGKNEEK